MPRDSSSAPGAPARAKEPLDTAARQDTQKAVAGLWEQFRGAIMGRVAVVEQAVTALLAGALDDDLRDGARREAHKLAGSVGLFGFTRGTDLAQEIERALLQETALGREQVLRLSQLVATLRQELERSRR